MAGRFTILSDTPRGILSREERAEGSRVLSDLQLDRAFRTICPDSIYREAFLNVLLTPLTDPDEIRERQRILAVFREKPQLLERLIEEVRRLLLTKKSWDEERSRLMHARHVNPQDKSLVLWVARENLVLTAHFLRIFLIEVREIHEILNMFGANEGWLGRLTEAAGRIGTGGGCETLLSYADKIEKGLANAHTYEIECDLNEELRANVPFLTDFAFVPVSKKPERTRRGWFGRLAKGPEADPVSMLAPLVRQTPVEDVDLEWGQEAAARAVQESDRVLTQFLRTLADRFTDLETELYFYQCALIYIRRFEDRHVTFTFPEILPEEENVLEIGELSDLLLLTESMSVLSVIPNDVSYATAGEGGVAGLLVTGKNSSGKTVYLRSIGGAVLLAQCGLPIPAKSARISVRRRIFTAFARAEGELIPDASAGRFEEEVAQIAAIIRDMEPNSLLLLNETFQTTSYDEGADGMAPILSYLASIGCGFIFVTHLTRLMERYRQEGGVRVMRTSDDPRTRYKIRELK